MGDGQVNDGVEELEATRLAPILLQLIALQKTVSYPEDKVSTTSDKRKGEDAGTHQSAVMHHKPTLFLLPCLRYEKKSTLGLRRSPRCKRSAVGCKRRERPSLFCFPG